MTWTLAAQCASLFWALWCLFLAVHAAHRGRYDKASFFMLWAILSVVAGR